MAAVEEKKPRKTYLKYKVYQKWIELDHAYDEEKANILKNALESEWMTYVFIDPKFRPNDKLEEVTTSHEINVANVSGKMNVDFTVRTRNSCPRYNKDLIKQKAVELFGAPMPPVIQPAKPTAEIINEPIVIDDPALALSDDDVSEISDVPSIPKLVRQVAQSNISVPPELDEPSIDEPEDDEKDLLYHEYNLYKMQEKEDLSESPKSKTEKPKTEKETEKPTFKMPINKDHATGFFVGALIMKFLLGVEAGPPNVSIPNKY